MKFQYILFLFKSLNLIPFYFKENKLTVKNIKNFLSGTYRLYHFEAQPAYIKEQIWYRLSVMNPACIEKKACIMCGCEFLGLSMIEDACKGNCYPKIMTLNIWDMFKSTYSENLSTRFKTGQKIIKENINFIP